MQPVRPATIHRNALLSQEVYQPEGVLPLEGLGPRLNLNSPQQITDAFRSIGIELADTKVWTLLKVEHPAARDLLRKQRGKVVGSVAVAGNRTKICVHCGRIVQSRDEKLWG